MAFYKVMVKLHESLKDEYAASADPRPTLVEKEESAYEQRKQKSCGLNGGLPCGVLSRTAK